MEFKEWSSLTISDQGRVVLLGIVGLLSIVSMLLPTIMIGFIGTWVGLFAILQSGLFMLDIFIRNQTRQMIPSHIFLKASIYGVIGIILMILPTDAMRSILGYLMILGLLFYAYYQWTRIKKYAIKRQAWAHYVWMIGSIGLSLLVAFNLNAVTTLLMVLIGGLGLFYSLTNGYALLVKKAINR